MCTRNVLTIVLAFGLLLTVSVADAQQRTFTWYGLSTMHWLDPVDWNHGSGFPGDGTAPLDDDIAVFDFVLGDIVDVDGLDGVLGDAAIFEEIRFAGNLAPFLIRDSDPVGTPDDILDVMYINQTATVGSANTISARLWFSGGGGTSFLGTVDANTLILTNQANDFNVFGLADNDGVFVVTGATTVLSVTGNAGANAGIELNQGTLELTAYHPGTGPIDNTSTGVIQVTGNNSTVNVNSNVFTYGGLDFTGGNHTLNVLGAGTLKVGGFNDNGNTTTVNVGSSPGNLVIDTVAAGSVIAGNTTFNVPSGVTFEALGNQAGAGPLGSGGSTINLTGGTARFSLGGGTAGIFNPASVPAGLEAHFDASQGVTVDGSNTVTQWDDLSGNGRHAVQTTGTGTLTAGEINGLPAVVFNASNENLNLTGTEFFAHDTYLVFRANNGTGKFGPDWGAPFGTPSQNDADRTWMLQPNEDRFWGNETPGAVTWNGKVVSSANEFDLSTVAGGGAEMDNYMVHKVTAGPENDIGRIRPYNIGTRMDQWTNARFATAEVLAFDHALTPDEENDVGGYLAAKYGITTTYIGSLGGPDVSGDLNMSGTNFAVTASSTLQAVTDGTATFGNLHFGGGVLTIEGADGGVVFNSISGSLSTGSGITSRDPVTLTGALDIDDGASVTLGGAPLTVTGGLTLNGGGAWTGTINTGADQTFAWPGAFNRTGVTTNLTHAGPGTLQLFDLGATEANQTSFTATGGAIQFRGATPLGGSTAPLTLSGGRIEIEGETVDGYEFNLLYGSYFTETGNNVSWLNFEGATYDWAKIGPSGYPRVFTGDKADTVLDEGNAKELLTHNVVVQQAINGFGMFPSASANDIAAFSGRFFPTVDGNYNFRWSNDNAGWMWMDLDDSGTFDAGEDIGSYTGSSNETVALTMAQGGYNFVYMASDWGGGYSNNFWYTSEGGSEVFVNPADPAQADQWGVFALEAAAIVSTAPVNVTAAGSELHSVSDYTATYGALTISAGADVTVSGAETTFDGALSIGDGGTLEVSGTTVNITGSTTVNGTAKVVVNSTLIGNDLTLDANDTWQVGGAGDVNYDSVTTTGTSVTVDFIGAATMTTNTFDDQNLGGARVLNVTQSLGSQGRLIFDAPGGGTITAADTTIHVGGSATFEARGNAPLGAGGSSISLDGGTAVFSLGGQVQMPDNLSAHFDAGAGVTVDGSNVVQTWADQSINGNDAAWFRGQPTLVADGFGGLPEVAFSSAGGNDVLQIASSMFAKEMYFVWRNADSTLTHNGLLGKTTGRGSTFIFDNNATTFHSNRYPESWARDGVAGVGWSIAPVDQEMLLKVVVNNEDLTPEGYWIAGIDGNNRPLDAFISEILAFDTKLSAAEEAAVGAYLNNKYGLGTSYTGLGVGDPIDTGSISATNVDFTLTTDSTIEASTDGNAAFGALTLGDGGTANGVLTTKGAVGTISFSGTTLVNLPAAGDVGFNTESNTNPGQIDFGGLATTLIKQGDADLIIDTPIIGTGGGVTFDVQAGRLVAIHGSNPIAGADVDINGAEVSLVGSGPASSVTFNNVFDSVTGGAIIAGRTGSGSAGSTVNAPNLTLTGGVLQLGSVDGNTLVLPNGLTSAAAGVGVSMVSGTVDVGTTFAVDTLIMDGGAFTLDTITNVSLGGTLSVTGSSLDMEALGYTMTTSSTDISVDNGQKLKFGQLNVLSAKDVTVNNATLQGQTGGTNLNFSGTFSALLGAKIIDINLAGTGGLTVDTSPDPDGFVDIGAGPHTYSGDTVIDYGALVVPAPAALSVNSNLKLSANDANVAAVLASTGTFSQAIGAGAGQFQWQANGGGFAARGGPLDVNIGGASAAIGWTVDLGAGIIGNGNVLQLGHTGVADGLVKILNPIDLDGAERTVLAVDNAASSTDTGELAGNLTNGTLKKTGNGTVDISGAGTALTGTNIENGAVRIADGSFAKLGAIALTGTANIDDGPDIGNSNFGVIETNRALPVVINATGGSDLDITFTNASVGASASDASGLMVSVAGPLGETEAAARARSITWSTDLANKPIVMGSVTAQGPVELLNPILIDSNTSRTFFVADNPHITGDVAIITIDGATTSRDGLRKGGDGELVVNTNSMLDINGHEFEIDAGTMTLAAGSTLRFHGLNEQDTRIEGGAVLLNKGTIIYDPNNSGQHEIRQRGTGTLRNEGVFSFSYAASATGNTWTRYEWDNDPDSAPGGKFVQAIGGSIDMKDGHNGVFRTENTNDIGSGVVIENGADITVTGNRNLYFRRQVGLDMTAGGALKATNDGSTGGEIIIENSTKFSADATTLLQADGTGTRIYIRNGDTIAANPDGVAFTMEAINGGQIRIGGQWSNPTAVLVGNAFIGEDFWSGAADTQINFHVTNSSTPGSLVWSRGHIRARSGHTITFQNDVIFNSIENWDPHLETQGTGQIVLSNGKTFTQNSTREIRITAATVGGDAVADFLNHGTVTWNTNGRFDTRDEAIFENATDGVIVSNAGTQGNMGREGGGNAQILNKGQILADNASSLWFREGSAGNDYLQLTDVGQAASGGNAIIEAKNGSTIGIQANMDFAADTLLKTSGGGRIELGGVIHGAELNGVIDGNVVIGEDLRTRGNAAFNMDVTASVKPGWLIWDEGTIRPGNGHTLTTLNNISYTSDNGEWQIATEGTGGFVLPNGKTLSHDGTRELRLYTNTNNADIDFLNHGTVTFTTNQRIDLYQWFNFENATDGAIIATLASGQMGREGNGPREIVNKGHILAENGKTMRFHDGGATNYLLVRDVGSAASGGNALIEADGGYVVFTSNIDFATDTQLKATNGGRIELGGYIHGAALNGVVEGDVRITQNLYTRQSAVIDLDLTNAATPDYLRWTGGSLIPQGGDTLTLLNNISYEGTNLNIQRANKTAQTVIAPGVTFLLPTLKGGELRLNGANDLSATTADLLNHGTIRIENGRRIALNERSILENATDGLITSGPSGTGFISRQQNDRNQFINKGHILADGGWLSIESRDPNNYNYLLFQDVGETASGGSAIIEAVNLGGIRFNGNVDFATDTVFSATGGGRIELGGAIQGTGIYGVAEGNVVIGEEVWTRSNAVIDVNVVNASTPGYLEWREASLRPNSGETLTLLTNIRYMGNNLNFDANGTGQTVIAPGVTFHMVESVGGNVYVNGDNNTGTIDLVNHGTIRVENGKYMQFNTRGVLENASDGVITSGASGTGRFNRQNNDYNTIINKGLVRADGGHLEFQSRNDGNNYLLFQDVGQAASGGTAIIEAVNGGTVRFNGQVSFAADTLFRTSGGGQIELGGQPMTAELNGVVQGDVVFGETLRTKANLTINLDLTHAATPGVLVWEDGGRLEARGGFDITIANNISYTGNDEYFQAWNASQFFIEEGVTFAIDTTNEVRVNDANNQPATPELVNKGTILFNPANFAGNGGRLELQNNAATGFVNDTTGLIRTTASSGGFYREGGGSSQSPDFENLGTIEVEGTAANTAYLEIQQLLDFLPYNAGTLESGTYRVIAGANQAALRIRGWNNVIHNNGISTIGAGATVVLSQLNAFGAAARFHYLNADGNVIDTVNGALYVHGFAEVDMASTVSGASAVLGGDGTINVAGTLTVSGGAMLDPSVLDADASSAGGHLIIDGDVDIDVSAIGYSYQPGDHVFIDGSLTHTTPTHTLTLHDGGAAYGNAVVMTAVSGTPTGLWNVVVAGDFGGDDIHFDNDAADLAWDSANWAKNGISGGVPTAAYNGLDLELSMNGAVEGLINTAGTPAAGDNAFIDGFAATGPAGAATVNNLSIANASSLTIGAAGNLTVTENVSLAGTLDTGAGTLGADAINVAATGQLDTTGTVNANSIGVVDGGVVNANGAVTVTGGIAVSGTMDVGAVTAAKTIDVAATGQLNVTAGGSATAAIQLNVAGIADVADTGTLATNQMSVTGTVQGAGDVTVANALDLDGTLSTGGTLTANSVDLDAATGDLTVLATGDLDVNRLVLPDSSTFSIDNTLAQNVVRYELDNVALTHDIGDYAGAAAHGGATTTTVIASGGTVKLEGTNTYTGRTEINGALLETASVSPGSLLVLNGGTAATEDSGVLQVLGGGTIARTVGDAPGGLTWEGAGGFSAKGGDATIDLTGSGVISWRTDIFSLPLLLSSSGADSKVTVQGDINLVSGQVADREVHVFNGSAAVDAELAGVISGGNDSSTLAKYGAGTLAMTGTNTYSSDTGVFAGTLKVNDNSNLGDAGSKVIVHGGATLSATNWTSGVRTVELVPGSAVTIDAQAGSTAMALQLEPMAASNTDLVKTGAGKASITNGLALLGSIDVNEGTLEIGTSLLAAPSTEGVTVGDGATLASSGVLQRQVTGEALGAHLEAGGDLVVGTPAGGFAFAGQVDVVTHTVLLVDPDTADVARASFAGGRLTSGNKIQFGSQTGPVDVNGEGVLLFAGDTSSEIGGEVLFGTPGGENTVLIAEGPNAELTITQIRRGNIENQGVSLTVPGLDDSGYSPAVEATAGATRNFVGTTDIELHGLQEYQPDGNDRPAGGEFTQFLIGDGGIYFKDDGSVVIDADKVMFDISYGGGFTASAGNSFKLIETEVYSEFGGVFNDDGGNLDGDGSLSVTGTLTADNFSFPDSNPNWTFNVEEGVGGYLEALISGVILQPGDTDGDLDVDQTDYDALLHFFGSDGIGFYEGFDRDCDFDDNGVVDIADFRELRTYYGTGVPPSGGFAPETTPEPSSAALLLLGLGAVIRKRKK